VSHAGAGRILGIDVGGTHLAAGVADRDGTLRSWEQEPTHRDEGPDAVIERLIALCRRAIDAAGPSSPELAAAGVGCGGPLDPERGVIQRPPNLPGWVDVPLADRLSAALGLRVFINNDADAAALGEHRYGAGRGVDNLVYLTVSTGIGGGIIIGGRLYSGESGNAGEIGHMSVSYDGWPCVCGRRGCPEAFASGTNIAARARAALAEGEATSVLAELQEVSARDVAHAAAAADPLARRVWDETMAVLGATVANVLNIFNPRMVIIGGGVASAGELLFEPVRRLALSQTLGPQSVGVEIVPAQLGEQLGVLGAVAVALERLETRRLEGATA
jgi:glucokinase